MKKELYQKLLQEVEHEHENQHLRTRNSKVLIIDGLNTFIRSWTTNPAMNEDGDHTGGVVGSLNSIGFQIRKFNPSRVVVVFDGSGGSKKRKKIFEGYKSERTKNRFRVNRQYPEMMNEEEEQLSMKRQFVWLNDMLDYLPLQTMIYDGMEADDVIAYIAQDLVKEDEEALIVSTDKDFLQLVSDKVTVFSPTKKKLYDREVVYKEWGLYPQNLLLFRTLDGDKSDNIPGVKGCGIKTFLKRFPEFEEDRLITFDELFEICEERKETYKIYDTILENKDVILRNKEIMSLSELTINGGEKLKIVDRFSQPDKKFDKMDFLRVGTKYKMLQNWRNINDWLMSTFNNIIIK
jgi:5'-3' exonuclease